MQKTDEIGNRKIKAIIFDMDNTLFDFVEAKLRACKAVVECVGNTDEMELVEYFLKDKIDIENIECIARYLKDRNIFSQDKFNECRKIYEEIKLGTILAYPGVIETLEKVKHAKLRLGVVTDAFKINAMARLRKAKLEKYFDIIVTADMTGKKKPEPDSIFYALEKLDVGPKETIFVGDSLHRDIAPANELGLVTMYAAYGDRNFMENRENSADFVLKDIRELIDILASSFNLF